MAKKFNGKLKNLYRKMIFGKILIALYVVLPMLFVATGFSAWVINTPSFSGDFYGTTTSSAVIDTSALLNVTKFEPVEELYYTGPVNADTSSDKRFKTQLNIETEIVINPNKVAILAKESSNIMYLKLALNLKSNSQNEAIFKNFNYDFSYINPIVGVNVEAMPEKATNSSSTYSVMFKLTFVEGVSFVDDFSLAMTPSFILSSDGYAAFYEHCVSRQIESDPFVLDLRLSESANL